MSDQPKPTGEWTAKAIEDICGAEGDTLARRVLLANAHNAALAAEWENGYQQGWEEGTFKALAAERERIKVLEDGTALNAVIATNQQLRDELKEAERNFAEADISTLQKALKELSAEREKVANLQSHIDTAQQNSIRRLNELKQELDDLRKASQIRPLQ